MFPMRLSRKRLVELRDELRQAGLRATRPRMAVLERLDSATAPLSHGELADSLASDEWDRATVYRNLIALTEAGLARRRDVGDHVWRFERVRESSGKDHESAHPHFMCIDCGDVSCLPELSLRGRGRAAIPRAIREQEAEISVRGVCDDCAAC